MIYYLECDQHGLDSIVEVVDDPNLTVINCPSYVDFDQAVIKIIKGGAGPNDRVVVDTITAIMNTIRADAKLGTDVGIDLFERGRAKYLAGDQQYLNVYNFAQNVVLRRLKNLVARHIPLTVLAQEAWRDDVPNMPAQRYPDVNPAFIEDLIGASSDVFRLYAVPEDITNTDGSVVYPRDTRVLYLRRKEGEYTAKYNVARTLSPKIPKLLTDPTLPMLYETLGKKPVFLLVYGHPGAGKTTLAVSDLTKDENE